MNVQQISGQNSVGFGNKVVIASPNPGAIRMLVDDIEAIKNAGDIVIKGDVFAKNSKLLITDGEDLVQLGKGAKVNDLAKDAEVVDIKGYSGALRSRFDNIVNGSGSVVDRITKAFKDSLANL